MWSLVFEHCSLNDHNGFLEDCSSTLIDKTDGSDPTRREEYWRRILKTVTPYGLNTIVEHDQLFSLGKFILFTYFISSICCFCFQISFFVLLVFLLFCCYYYYYYYG